MIDLSICLFYIFFVKVKISVQLERAATQCEDLTLTRQQSEESSDEDFDTDPNYFNSARTQKNAFRKKNRSSKPVATKKSEDIEILEKKSGTSKPVVPDKSDEIEILEVAENESKNKKSTSPQEKNKKLYLQLCPEINFFTLYKNRL